MSTISGEPHPAKSARGLVCSAHDPIVTYLIVVDPGNRAVRAPHRTYRHGPCHPHVLLVDREGQSLEAAGVTWTEVLILGGQPVVLGPLEAQFRPPLR